MIFCKKIRIIIILQKLKLEIINKVLIDKQGPESNSIDSGLTSFQLLRCIFKFGSIKTIDTTI